MAELGHLPCSGRYLLPSLVWKHPACPPPSRLRPHWVFPATLNSVFLLTSGLSQARRDAASPPLVRLTVPYPLDLRLDVTSSRKPLLTARTGCCARAGASSVPVLSAQHTRCTLLRGGVRGRGFCSGAKCRLDLRPGLCLELRVAPGCHLLPPTEAEEPCDGTHKREGLSGQGALKPGPLGNKSRSSRWLLIPHVYILLRGSPFCVSRAPSFAPYELTLEAMLLFSPRKRGPEELRP